MPAVSSAALTIAALAYPFIFGTLARFDLIAGSLVCAVILLSVPLVAMSSLNPLLIAIEQGREGKNRRPDAGSGTILFISTIGSVFGVILASFLLIPNIRNQDCMFIVSIITGGCSFGVLFRAKMVSMSRRVALYACALFGILVSGGILSLHSYRPRFESADLDGYTWKRIAAVPSSFGTINVVDLTDNEAKNSWRVLITDGMTQGGIFAENRSVFLYTYILEAAARAIAQNPRRVLALGLGVGILPTRFSSTGADVDVVELNQKIADVARKYFGFKDQRNIHMHFDDARTYVHSCKRDYDVIIVDVSLSEGQPEHLSTREFFRDVRSCLSPHGVMTMNGLLDEEHLEPFQALLATTVRTFGGASVIQEAIAAGEKIRNVTTVAAKDANDLGRLNAIQRFAVDVPDVIRPGFKASIVSAETVSPDRNFIRHTREMTDEGNHILAISSGSQMALRKLILESIPDFILAN